MRHYIEVGERQGLAPSSHFDPEYYLRTNPDLRDVGSLARHFIASGRDEGRFGSLTSQLIAEGLDEDAVTEGLIPPPEVGKSSTKYPDAFAIALRSIDQDLQFFSRQFYVSRYPDMASQTLDPVVHFLRYGRFEGRLTNVSLFKGIHINPDMIKDHSRFAIVGVHEASMTGAPVVGLDLATEMASTQNIIFISLRDGPLVEVAKKFFPIVIVASPYDVDNTYIVDYVERHYKVRDAIFSSSACVPFIRPLSSGNCRITCLVHEFLEYMIDARSVIYLCDLLVFSSRQLLKSWQYMLDDLERDSETIMVLPQPASSANVRMMSKAAAREALTATIGLDLEGAVLVLGAGQIQIRKGTDIFLQIGNQLKREKGKFVTVWIGEQVSEFDMGFGVWFHAQMERSRDSSGALSVHFEPPGPLYPILMDAADVFLVTSRLDPLPNVALDAAARGVPVIAFAGATGLADIAEQGLIELLEVEIAAVDQVIAAIKSCAITTQASIA
ncbi:MAG: glycosyltransferase [Sphingomonas sp.]